MAWCFRLPHCSCWLCLLLLRLQGMEPPVRSLRQGPHV